MIDHQLQSFGIKTDNDRNLLDYLTSCPSDAGLPGEFFVDQVLGQFPQLFPSLV